MHLRDRKSTRLNSSHLVISYAVFCLKKKKETCVSVSRSYDDAYACTSESSVCVHVCIPVVSSALYALANDPCSVVTSAHHTHSVTVSSGARMMRLTGRFPDLLEYDISDACRRWTCAKHFDSRSNRDPTRLRLCVHDRVIAAISFFFFY